jgi:hypothetical protein
MKKKKQASSVFKTRFKCFLVFFQADLIWKHELRRITTSWSGRLASDNGCVANESWGVGGELSESNQEQRLCHLRVSQYTQEIFAAGPPLAREIS